MVGVFEEPRGKFSMFRGTDKIGGSPIHIHHYFEFKDDRIYISNGWSDYGQYTNRR